MEERARENSAVTFFRIHRANNVPIVAVEERQRQKAHCSAPAHLHPHQCLVAKGYAPRYHEGREQYSHATVNQRIHLPKLRELLLNA